MKIPTNKIGLEQLRVELRDVINYFDSAPNFVNPDIYSYELHCCCLAIANVCQACMLVLNNEIQDTTNDDEEPTQNHQ